jgi:uracil-DNA glycosylase
MNNIHESWKPLFDKFEFYLDALFSEAEDDVYPPKKFVFRVFELDVNEIKVVLLGQDPYHGPNQAHGLSFSVSKKIKIPPSLQNIFKELKLEFPERNYEFKNGDLSRWFNEEKIFLLNTSLTVLKSKPGSHMDIWSNFTDKVIQYISDNNDNCIFLLLGKPAKEKINFINNKNNIVTGVHPSPMAQGFIGSNVFKKVEQKLNEEINWSN